jgi:hypothetical protein
MTTSKTDSFFFSKELTWIEYILEYIIDVDVSTYAKHPDILSIMASFEKHDINTYGP